jgi:hypothetical protein
MIYFFALPPQRAGDCCAPSRGNHPSHTFPDLPERVVRNHDAVQGRRKRRTNAKGV